MKKRVFVRILTILLILALCITPLPVATLATNITDNSVITTTATDGVYWSSTSTDKLASITVSIGGPNALSSFGLSPRATKNGVTSYSFTWTSSNTSVATVNASSGYVTGVSTGTTVITGTSSTYGSSIGQLTLIVFVAQTADVTMFALRETGVNRYSAFSTIETLCSERYSSFRKYGTQASETTMDQSLFTAYMASSKILYFRGHGTKSSAVLSLKSDGSFKSRLYMSYLQTLPSNAFSYCDLILYGACLTGEGGEGANNLVNATVDCGVNTVVGFETEIYCEEMNIWGVQFFAALMNGCDVNAACVAAKAYIQEYHEDKYTQDDGTLAAEEYYIGGNKTATFN